MLRTKRFNQPVIWLRVTRFRKHREMRLATESKVSNVPEGQCARGTGQELWRIHGDRERGRRGRGLV